MKRARRLVARVGLPLALALALIGLARPAPASLTRAQLGAVAARPATAAALSLDSILTDQHGRTQSLRSWIGDRPAVLVLADYRCTQLCGPMLSVAARTLQTGDLKPDVDYRLLVVDFNPAAVGRDGEVMRQEELDAFPDLERAALFLTATPDVVELIERSLGFHALYDAAAGRFAHPATVFVLTSDGRVSRVLDGLALDPDTVRLALVEAGQERIGSLVDRIHVLCYGLDPATGLYTGSILFLLKIGAILTLGGIIALVLSARRSGRRKGEPV